MFGLRRKSFVQVDGALESLKRAVCEELLPSFDRRGTVYVYAEANPFTIDYVLLVRDRHGDLVRLPADQYLKLYVRELWTQFRIARLPVWAAIALVSNRSGRADVSYVHADMIDAKSSFEDRARRWMVRIAGVDAVAACAQIVPVDVAFATADVPERKSRRVWSSAPDLMQSF
jgi:hypothetical protein